MQEMRSGTLVTMPCSFGSAVFKQLLNQQVHDAGTDPDFRDDRRVRLDLNQSIFCNTLYVPIGHLKCE